MNVEKIELYKVKGYGNLYIDANGNPFVVRPKFYVRGGRNMKEKRLVFTKGRWFDRNCSILLKDAVAKTLVDENAKYVDYKDGNPNNCHPDNLKIVEKYFRPSDYTDENSFVCKACGDKVLIKEDNYKEGLCQVCKDNFAKINMRHFKPDKFRALYEYLIVNKEYFRQTDLRDKILEKFSEGKNYSQTAREIGVSRQCVHESIQNALETIERKKNKLGGLVKWETEQ